MLPKTHAILGFIFSTLSYFTFPITIFQAILIFLSSFLIDFDHYWFYVKKTKDWNLKRASNWKVYLSKKHKPIMHIFHTIEFIILIIILSFFWNIFLFILIGMLFHSILDIIDLIYRKVINIREFSLIRYLIRDKINYL